MVRLKLPPIREQNARRRQIDAIRLMRPLFPFEQEEHDRLAEALYQRERRARLAERGIR